ncbi:uncharacterized protein LOC135099170 isoform X3 [Scylla paramamosain]|uniref:uncharacterized protein LOC135099170 isoform X3 n=1 Tax=Scylla paramamosain TaxID=85552 RepID=UPI003083C9AE
MKDWTIEQWRGVLWSDESRFIVTASSQGRVYRRPGSDPLDPRYTAPAVRFPDSLMDKRTSQPAHHTQVNNHSVVTAEKHNQHDPFSPESQRIPKSVEDQILTRTGWHLTVFNRLKGFSMEHC